MRVTVGIPFYNAEQTLADAVRSVFAQSYQDWELILLDDGSTDGSLEIARSVSDPRVKVISDGRNLRLNHRLNELSGLSGGEYITRMDADDMMHPERLAQQVKMLDENPGLDVIGTAVYTIDSANEPNGIRNSSPLEITPLAVFTQAILVHPTIMGRAQWFRNNPYDESFFRSEDYELWCRTYSTSSFANIPRPLLFYREGVRTPEKYLGYYLQSVSFVKKALRIHGPGSIGWAHTVRLMVIYSLKAEIYRYATLIGKQNTLIRKRNRPINEQERHIAQEGLELIMHTQVPGLDAAYPAKSETTSN